jgi:predicted transcriptional regulator
MLWPDEQEKIRKAVEDVASELNNIDSKVQQRYQDERAYHEIYQSIVETLSEEKEIGIKELKHKVGVRKDSTVTNMIMYMKRSGLVHYSDESDMVTDKEKIRYIGNTADNIDLDDQTDPELEKEKED